MSKVNLLSLFNALVQNGTVPTLQKENINEFVIGKNYFYQIVTNEKFVHAQNVINKVFQEAIPINNAAVAFRKKLSYLHLFEPHSKNYHFLRLDIKSFFHSVNINDVRSVFQAYFEEDYIDEYMMQSLLDAFINIVTYKVPDDSPNEIFRGKEILPMGFVTSPVISNIIFRQLDIQIQKLCFSKQIIYTRYADDMLFSMDKSNSYVHSESFINEISIILSQMNFKLNKNKTVKAKHTISLNGYTIQYSRFEKESKENQINEVRLSNKKLQVIKKLIHYIEIENIHPKVILKKLFNYTLPLGIPVEKLPIYYNHQLLNKLTGYRSYLVSFIKFNDQYKCAQESTIKKYLDLICDLDRIIGTL